MLTFVTKFVKFGHIVCLRPPRFKCWHKSVSIIFQIVVTTESAISKEYAKEGPVTVILDMVVLVANQWVRMIRSLYFYRTLLKSWVNQIMKWRRRFAFYKWSRFYHIRIRWFLVYKSGHLAEFTEISYGCRGNIWGECSQK